jgi:septal ring factor EnvC (AmiA/AmiB activator)
MSAQSSKRKRLEARRVQLQKDKVYINALLSNTKRREKNVMIELNDLKDKIRTRENLIKAMTGESNELGNEIYLNQLEINRNTRELKALKEDYGEMIFKSYKSRSQNSRIMFLLSSSNFLQAYKRFQYMKQYTAFRKTQGEKIQLKMSELQVLTDSLQVKKNQKEELLGQMKLEQAENEKDKKAQEGLLREYKKKENRYKRQIRDFQREEERIDAQIEEIIRAAIADSNKSGGAESNAASGAFALTAEARELAAQFTQNKGKLPWPVEKGYVSTYYGKQPHPVVRSATIQSNGVRITTAQGSKARAVFDGTVLAVQLMTGNRKVVLIQHGNYITVYKNLETVSVAKGDKVKTKEEIGTVFTDKITGKTILGFLLSRNTKTENPKNWIYKM